MVMMGRKQNGDGSMTRIGGTRSSRSRTGRCLLMCGVCTDWINLKNCVIPGCTVQFKLRKFRKLLRAMHLFGENEIISAVDTLPGLQVRHHSPENHALAYTDTSANHNLPLLAYRAACRARPSSCRTAASSSRRQSSAPTCRGRGGRAGRPSSRPHDRSSHPPTSSTSSTSR